MRSGVRSRPSRLGSSPSRTSNSRNNSAVLADINVTGSSAFLTILIPLTANFSATGIFKGVEHGFFHPDLFYLSMAEALRKNAVDLYAQILSGWHCSIKFR